MKARIQALDKRIRAWMKVRGPAIVRVSLGIVFLWFGLLKVFGESPAAQMVADTLRFLPADTAVMGVGVLEVLLGVGLVGAVLLRPVIVVLWLHLLGTFLVFLLLPDQSHRGNPFLLTLEGEFVVKNIVLIAAGIVVAGNARRLRLPTLPP